VHYDLCLVVKEATNPVEAYQQAVLKWFNKILKIDLEAVIYPWGAADCQAGTSVIEDLDELPTMLSSIKKYTPKAWIRLKGGTLYPKVLVGMEVDPTTVVDNISWWLQSTKQGMWPSHLLDAEDTTCLGWLLSTDEIDKEALRKEIWQMTGVQVALCYWAINDGIPKGQATNTTKDKKEKAAKTVAPALVKALHLEINVLEPYASCCQVETIFSSTAEAFPLDIKLHLVWDARLLTNPTVKVKATSL